MRGQTINAWRPFSSCSRTNFHDRFFTASPDTRLVITRFVAQGMNAASGSFTVTNSGGETLAYTISDTNDDEIDWISLEPTEGVSTGEADKIAIAFATSGLANGRSEGTIGVSAGGATNSPQSILVVLFVGGDPSLESRWDTFNWDTDNWGPIPEPSSMLLNFSALVALAGLHRIRGSSRSKSRRQTARCRVADQRA